MRIVVVDSSVIVKWLNQYNEELLLQAESVLTDASKDKIELFAPELAKYEVGNVLLVSKKLTSSDAKESLEFFYSLPITFVPETEELANQTYKIAQQGSITYYDASFVALAKREAAVLITDNPKHQARQFDVRVIPLKDY